MRLRLTENELVASCSTVMNFFFIYINFYKFIETINESGVYNEAVPRHEEDGLSCSILD